MNTHGSIWRVARTIAWRSVHTYVRRPDLFVPSLLFPLVFLAAFVVDSSRKTSGAS